MEIDIETVLAEYDRVVAELTRKLVEARATANILQTEVTTLTNELLERKDSDGDR